MDPVIIVLLIFILFCLFMVYYTSHLKAKTKKELSKLKDDRHASLIMALNHFNGLPVAENTITQIFSCPNEYEFLANNTSFKLDKSKVQDISITNDVEIQKSYTSSVGGAIGGAVLFGPLGAMIGGRAKEKTSRTINNYLIFTYLDNNEIKYIAFHCSSISNANKFIKEFKQNNQNKSTIVNL